MIDALKDETLERLFAREMEIFLEARPITREMIAEGSQHMPHAVPMSWMAGLYRHLPLFAVGGTGSRFEDVDGHSYIDFNLADLSNTVGYGNHAVAKAVAKQAGRGLQYLLPSPVAVPLAKHLAVLTGQPSWQFTLSASGAITEVIRIARALTKRQKIVLFEGRYHGHVEQTMAIGGLEEWNSPAQPEAKGISPAATMDTVNVPFNDLSALRRALSLKDVALVLIEPALTNCTLVLPDAGFLEQVRALARQSGALLAYDETHTWQLAYGGFVGQQEAKPDFVVLGKGLGSGVPLGAYGFGADIHAFLEANLDVDISDERGVALGGTMYANPLSLTAAFEMLQITYTREQFEHIAILGDRLADGLEYIIRRNRLPWRAFRYGPRSGFCLGKELPRSYEEARPSLHARFSDVRRLYMANRGIWDAIVTAGPQVSFAHSIEDIDWYLEVMAAYISEISQ